MQPPYRLLPSAQRASIATKDANQHYLLLLLVSHARLVALHVGASRAPFHSRGMTGLFQEASRRAERKGSKRRLCSTSVATSAFRSSVCRPSQRGRKHHSPMDSKEHLCAQCHAQWTGQQLTGVERGDQTNHQEAERFSLPQWSAAAGLVECSRISVANRAKPATNCVFAAVAVRVA